MNNDQTKAEDKKNKWLNYGFWIIAIALAIASILFFIGTFDHKVNEPVPSGYRFVVEDHYAKSGVGWATYYIYDSYILVRKDDAENTQPPLIYDVADAAKLTYDENDTVKTCDIDSCYDYPKILNTIKKLIANKFGREYTGQ